MAIQMLASEERLAPKLQWASRGQPVELHRRRLELDGVCIDQIDLPSAVERIHGFVQSGTPHQVVTVNLDFLAIAQRNPQFRETINHADLAVADGMPLVWLSRLRQQSLPARITGVELVHQSCQIAGEGRHGVFLLGAGPGVAEVAARRLEVDYPGIRIAGVYSPPFGQASPEQDQQIVEMIQRAAPAFLFVALGAPRQDLWIRSYRDQLNVPVAMGVGCVFDLLAGCTQRAPGWMQQAGLEWSYRLLQEPQRLWRRYVLEDIPVLSRLVLGSIPVPHGREAVTTAS